MSTRSVKPLSSNGLRRSVASLAAVAHPLCSTACITMIVKMCINLLSAVLSVVSLTLLNQRQPTLAWIQNLTSLCCMGRNLSKKDLWIFGSMGATSVLQLARWPTKSGSN